MLILDGKIVRDHMADALKRRIQNRASLPVLAIVQVGSREDSNAYITQKKLFAERIGAEVLHIQFPNEVGDEELAEKISQLNSDPDTHGIIVQMPLPRHLHEGRLIDVVDYKKDVDGLTATNIKLLVENKRDGFVPATAKGIISLLDYYKIPIEGKRAVVVGRSPSVGKPIALALLNKNATVTVAHSHSGDLPSLTQEADILVVAVGRSGFIKKEYVRSGQVVIDVGINTFSQAEILGKVKPENELPKRELVGDVDFESVKDIVAAITPVPGGVGPMTVASLFENVVDAFERKQLS